MTICLDVTCIQYVHKHLVTMVMVIFMAILIAKITKSS